MLHGQNCKKRFIGRPNFNLVLREFWSRLQLPGWRWPKMTPALRLLTIRYGYSTRQQANPTFARGFSSEQACVADGPVSSQIRKWDLEGPGHNQIISWFLVKLFSFVCHVHSVWKGKPSGYPYHFKCPHRSTGQAGVASSHSGLEKSVICRDDFGKIGQFFFGQFFFQAIQVSLVETAQPNP